MTQYDPVSAPKHYLQTKYSPAQIAADWKLNFFLGNVVKYVGRSAHSGKEVEDLKKAKKYLEMQIELLEKGDLKETIAHGPSVDRAGS